MVIRILILNETKNLPLDSLSVWMDLQLFYAYNINLFLIDKLYCFFTINFVIIQHSYHLNYLKQQFLPGSENNKSHGRIWLKCQITPLVKYRQNQNQIFWHDLCFCLYRQWTKILLCNTIIQWYCFLARTYNYKTVFLAVQRK